VESLRGGSEWRKGLRIDGMIHRHSKVIKTWLFIQRGGFSYIAALLLQILLLVSDVPNGWAESSPIDRVDGYGGYKFGMTIQEADAVRADDIVNKACEFNAIEACIERKTEFFGEEATILALVSSQSHKVERVNISFDRTRPATPGACKKVLSSIAGPLIKTFGTNTKEEGANITWHFTRGGKVTLARLCINEDMGMVIISYSPSDAFR
jgi:hypothetical protein